jgi:lauroyl/myristoyl acyltransferase
MHGSNNMRTDARSGDLAARLAAADKPVRTCRMPSAPWRVWLGTAQPLRRLIPAGVAVRRARSRGVRMWERMPEERERARRAMAAIVTGTHREHEVEQLARLHVIDGRVRETLFWHPWRIAPLAPMSAACLTQALADGRGVLISTCHTGPYNIALEAFTATGRTVYSASAWALDEIGPGYWGRRVALRRNRAARRGERIVRAAGSYPVLAALLQRGEVLSVFFSMPGSKETTFLGKPAMLASGSARLAVSCDALILPVCTRVHGHRIHVDVAAPLDPRRYGDMEHLHDALAALHERWLLEAPEAMEDPNRAGAWAGAAAPDGWRLP